MHKVIPELAVIGSLIAVVFVFSTAGAAGATYYVSPTGNDKAAGSMAAPWKTIQKAANVVKAGDTVVVKAGTYAERVKFNTKINHSGTAGNPVTFKSETPLGAIVTGGFDTRNAHYLVIDGFKITSTIKGGTGGGVLIGSNKVTVVNNHIYDVPDAGLRAYVTSTFSPSGIVVKDNVITGSQFGLIQAGNDWLVENNDINNLKRWVTTSDVDYIRFTGDNLAFRGNRLFGTTRANKGTAVVNGWQSTLAAGKQMRNVEISGNVVKAFDEGVNLTAAVTSIFDGVKIFNNIFDGRFPDGGAFGAYGIYAKSYVANVNVEHNTFSFLSVGGVRVSGQSKAIVRNNIFAQTIRNYYLDTAGQITGGYNLIDLLHASTFRDSKDLINVDPKFIAGGFDLDLGSPAIDQALAGGVSVDIAGRSRLTGTAPDIGAYESNYIVVDNTPPVTVASPPGGTYLSAQSIFLQADEEGETFYCLGDNCLPTTLYTGAINISSSNTLRFYSRDVAGNNEAVNQELYTINTDQTAPITTAYPPGGTYEEAVNVSFLRNEPGITFYCRDVGCNPTTPYGGVPTNLDSSATIRFYSVDEVGNNEVVKEESYTIGSVSEEPATTTPPIIIIATSTATTTATTTIINDQKGDDEVNYPVASAGGGGGGGVGTMTFLATTSTSTLATSTTNGSQDIQSLGLKLVELQRTLINLLQQLIAKGQKVSLLMTETLAAVGSLFLLGFKL